MCSTRKTPRRRPAETGLSACPEPVALHADAACRHTAQHGKARRNPAATALLAPRYKTACRFREYRNPMLPRSGTYTESRSDSGGLLAFGLARRRAASHSRAWRNPPIYTFYGRRDRLAKDQRAARNDPSAPGRRKAAYKLQPSAPES